jgi:hypothetical protein
MDVEAVLTLFAKMHSHHNKVAGTVRPRALAVFRLMINSKFVGCAIR